MTLRRRLASIRHALGDGIGRVSRKSAGHVVMAALLLFAQAVAVAHRIEHADHDAQVPAGHNCIAFDAVLGASGPPPTIVLVPLQQVLPRPVESVAFAPAPHFLAPRAAFRPRDPPTSLPS